MISRACPRCRHPLPPVGGGFKTRGACSFCTAQGLATPPPTFRRQPPAPQIPRAKVNGQRPEDLQKKSDAFASALVESAARATPVQPFAVPPEALPATRTAPARTTNATATEMDVTPPPVMLTPSPAPLALVPPPAKVVSTATLASPVLPPTRAPVLSTPSQAPVLSTPRQAPVPSLSQAPDELAATPPPIVLVPPPSISVGSLDPAGFEISTESSAYDLGSLRPNMIATVTGVLRRVPRRGLGVAAISAVGVMLLGVLVTKGGGLRGLSRSPAGASKTMALPASRPSSSPIVHASTVTPPSFARPAPARLPLQTRPQRSPKSSAHVQHADPRAVRRVATPRRVVAMAAVSASTGAPASESDRVAKARKSYSEGNERLLLGDATVAVSAYQEAIRLNPKDPAPYRGLGLAWAQEGKRTDAIRSLRAYLKRAPQARDRALISDRISLLNNEP